MKDAVAAQIRAATPGASSWVSANAGSGKTRVLTDRVARLLLAGTDPAKILCLTYTKAAAAEMQNRLFRTLGAWAMLEDGALHTALAALGEPGVEIAPDRLAAARRLFARALETPGGLRIQTIHAFCDALLRRFPLEAGVAPQFAVLEDRQARALREAVLDVLAETAPAAFEAMARHLSGDDPDPLLTEIAHHRAAFAGDFDRDRLAAALGIAPDLSFAALAAEVLPPDCLPMLRAVAALAAMSGPKDQEAADELTAALTATDPEIRLCALECALLAGKGAGSPFTARTGSFPAKRVRTANPELLASLDALMLRVEVARPRRLGLAALDKSSALNCFARRFLAAYGARKAALGLLDFDDLIDRTRALLARRETAAWVLWRLDGGIDHILVDEAQDTSPAQWQVIEAISAEFFAGTGARALARTIFVVGDEKQSIYSFQGADPAAFGGMQHHFDRMLVDMGAALQRCDLLYSFRSARPILALVDAVFRGRAAAGLAPSITHHAIDPDRPGRVELWPFLETPETPQQPPWDDPVDTPADDDPVQLLAVAIAARIRGMLDSGQALPGSAAGRAIAAGDVLILVQRRGGIFHAIIRALKRARVPVAGADVLRVGAELAVQDLLAALRVAATPADDLSLAAFLRSPLGGMTEADLFALAHGRPGTLWQALRSAPPGRWADPRALLGTLRAQADYLRPFELLTRILVRHDGRRLLTARLGPEAEDGIDALLDQALVYERVEPPSLTGFLGWIDRDEMTVKRRMEESANEVRVMTVHGAKGLEAPIVILPDTAQRQDGRNAPQILRLPDGTAAWRSRAADTAPLLAEAEAGRRALLREENRRLLYVGLTRARSWLIVCGAGRPGGPDDSWYGLVAEALASLGPTAVPGPQGDTLVLAHNWTEASATAGGLTAPVVPAVPEWARRAAPRPLATRQAISPSALGGGHVLAPPHGAGEPDTEAVAKVRGEAIHRLLEVLHGRPAADRAGVAARLLPLASGLPELLREVCAILDAPGLAPLFAPGALVEVEITAPLAGAGGARLAGRIDRLIVAPDRVIAVDFKSNRTVPDRPDAVPEGILRQMGAYRAALAAIWPDRAIETAILWTRTAQLMPLPDPLVRAALARALRLDPPGPGS